MITFALKPICLPPGPFNVSMPEYRFGSGIEEPELDGVGHQPSDTHHRSELSSSDAGRLAEGELASVRGAVTRHEVGVTAKSQDASLESATDKHVAVQIDGDVCK
jgi:hypothetical protein